MHDSPEPNDALLNKLTLSNRRSLAEDVVDLLRAALVRGAFPPGQHLNEAGLAEKLGVSRGPIREAFAELEREGLLKLERHRGARVTRLSATDIEEIYELRSSLERLAIERATQRATQDDFAALAEVVAGMTHAVDGSDLHEVVTLDVRFHDLIYVAAHNSRLYLTWSTLRPQIETFLHSRSIDTSDYLAKVVGEHTALLDAVRARSKSDAVRLIDSHIRTSYERLSQVST
ncbi:MAG: GntR family transcriptional regulator [Candidatus Velthaea sp.]|jgi:DNA-binding GntR family transcriptional regulator